MATVDIMLVRSSGKGDGGRVLPVPDSVPSLHEVKASSGTSQPTTGSASGANDTPTNEVWVVTVAGGNVRVKFGTGTPVAADAANGGWLVLDGQTREFAAFGGQKAAVIDSAAGA